MKTFSITNLWASGIILEQYLWLCLIATLIIVGLGSVVVFLKDFRRPMQGFN